MYKFNIQRNLNLDKSVTLRFYMVKTALHYHNSVMKCSFSFFFLNILKKHLQVRKIAAISLLFNNTTCSLCPTKILAVLILQIRSNDPERILFFIGVTCREKNSLLFVCVESLMIIPGG